MSLSWACVWARCYRRPKKQEKKIAHSGLFLQKKLFAGYSSTVATRGKGQLTGETNAVKETGKWWPWKSSKLSIPCCHISKRSLCFAAIPLLLGTFIRQASLHESFLREEGKWEWSYGGDEEEEEEGQGWEGWKRECNPSDGRLCATRCRVESIASESLWAHAWTSLRASAAHRMRNLRAQK